MLPNVSFPFSGVTEGTRVYPVPGLIRKWGGGMAVMGTNWGVTAAAATLSIL